MPVFKQDFLRIPTPGGNCRLISVDRTEFERLLNRGFLEIYANDHDMLGNHKSGYVAHGREIRIAPKVDVSAMVQNYKELCDSAHVALDGPNGRAAYAKVFDNLELLALLEEVAAGHVENGAKVLDVVFYQLQAVACELAELYAERAKTARVFDQTLAAMTESPDRVSEMYSDWADAAQRILKIQQQLVTEETAVQQELRQLTETRDGWTRALALDQPTMREVLEQLATGSDNFLDSIEPYLLYEQVRERTSTEEVRGRIERASLLIARIGNEHSAVVSEWTDYQQLVQTELLPRKVRVDVLCEELVEARRTFGMYRTNLRNLKPYDPPYSLMPMEEFERAEKAFADEWWQPAAVRRRIESRIMQGPHVLGETPVLPAELAEAVERAQSLIDKLERLPTVGAELAVAEHRTAQADKAELDERCTVIYQQLYVIAWVISRKPDINRATTVPVCLELMAHLGMCTWAEAETYAETLTRYIDHPERTEVVASTSNVARRWRESDKPWIRYRVTSRWQVALKVPEHNEGTVFQYGARYGMKLLELDDRYTAWKNSPERVRNRRIR